MTYILDEIKATTIAFCKWLIYSLIIGISCGIIGSAFSILLTKANAIRLENPWLLYFLPVGGILIVAMYHITKQLQNSGTNIVIDAIQSGDYVPKRVAPLIFISTIITHLCGGSAGREGAALQIGGSFGNFFANVFHLDENDTRIMIMCGMSACFSALFGTPMAAAIFSLEVISVGVMYYAALVPCVLSAFIAHGVALYLGIQSPHFALGDIPALSAITGGKIIIISIIFAIVSAVFCISLHKTRDFFNNIIKNPYLKIIVAGCAIVLLTTLVGNYDYNGSGNDIIAGSFITRSMWYVFILKIIFTSITLSGGFKGGEIVPTLFIGATLGSFLAPVLGLPIALGASCGMVGMFCGVTNCPLTSILMAIELFDVSGIHYAIIVIAICYLFSGYFSLYNSQKIVYSKLKTKYININSK